MKQQIRNMTLVLVLMLSSSIMTVPAIASATFKDDACQGVSTLNSTGCSDTASTTVSNLMATIVQIFSIIVGFVAVMMVIVGGIKYITANGDSGALASARNTIMYALIGLVVVALAQILVHFVLHTTVVGLPAAHHHDAIGTVPN